MNYWLKNGILYLICGVILISVVLNVNRQMGVLFGARKKTAEIKRKNELLEKENVEMRRKIEYATSSAYIDRQARISFGLGSGDDYWLSFEENGKWVDLFPQINIGDEKPKYQQWIDLFR